MSFKTLSQGTLRIIKEAERETSGTLPFTTKEAYMSGSIMGHRKQNHKGKIHLHLDREVDLENVSQYVQQTMTGLHFHSSNWKRESTQKFPMGSVRKWKSTRVVDTMNRLPCAKCH